MNFFRRSKTLDPLNSYSFAWTQQALASINRHLDRHVGLEEHDAYEAVHRLTEEELRALRAWRDHRTENTRYLERALHVFGAPHDEREHLECAIPCHRRGLRESAQER